MKKTAIIGASGFIGGHLFRFFRGHFSDTVGTFFSSPRPDFTFFDVTSHDLSKLRLSETSFESVIITSAISNTRFCEINPVGSAAINVSGMLRLIEAIGKQSLQCIFLSSDYVFDGSSGGYQVEDPVDPATEYGRQKATVEREIPNLVESFLVLRLSKVFGLERGGGCFLDLLASDLRAGKSLRLARDQFFCPTCVIDLIKAIVYLQNTNSRGFFNICGTETFSRFQIAQMLAAKMGLCPKNIEDISLHDIPEMQHYPLNTSMVCSLDPHVRRQLFRSFDHYLSVIASGQGFPV